MNALLSWIDERTELCSCTRDWLGRPVAGGPAWRNVWPATIAFMFFTQAVTGIVLWMYYSPGAQNAWESVYYLQSHVLGGWLLRAVHHYAAQVMLVLVGIYLVHTIVCRTYRAPREFVFWIIVCSGLLVLALNLTGDLLPWDQNGFWSTRVRTGFLLLLPGVGGGLFKLAIGGPSMGNLTLTRFFALHAGVLPAILLGLLVLHAWLGGRGGNGGKSEKGEKGGNGEKGEIADPSLARRLTPPARLHPSSLSYWPHQAMRDALACLAVLAVVIGLSLQHGVSGQRAGVELGAPANPVEAYAAARPEWSFRGLYEFAHLFPARLELLPIFVIPGLIVLVVLLMPWIGRRWLGQWFNVGFISLLLVGLVVLSWRSLARDAGDPEYQKALAAGQAEAQRAQELARSPQGIPASGALGLLRGDSLMQGPRLFQQYCASCHAHTAAKEELFGKSQYTAPNLYGFATRRWLAGLLDPHQIAGPQYFGNTRLKNKEMPSFVKNTLGKLDAGEKRDLQKLVTALSAEAGLKSQRVEDARDAAAIKEGRAMPATFGCTDCHKFRKEGHLGDAPDLTGYGSRPWLVGIISNPAHRQFYGKRNDRMPAYAPSNDPADNVLSPRDLGLLADWLRGEWYVEGE